jgi:hypothetical protein
MPLGPHIEFSEAWHGYLTAVELLWNQERTPTSSRPHLALYESLATEDLALMRDVGLGAAVQEAYLRQLADPRTAAPGQLYVLELKSFAQAVSSTNVESVQSRRDLLGDVSTLANSAKDIFSDLPGWVKAGIHGFGEVAKLFKRK